MDQKCKIFLALEKKSKHYKRMSGLLNESKLKSLKILELRKLCKEHGIKKYSKYKKNELIEYIIKKVSKINTKPSSPKNGSQQSDKSEHALKIQKVWRGHVVRTTLGPAFLKHRTELVNTCCVSGSEFLTDDNKPSKEVPPEYFFSFKEDGQYYAFDLRALYKQIQINGRKNPFTNKEFHEITMMYYGRKYKHCIKNRISLNFPQEENQKINDEQRSKHYCMDMFLYLDRYYGFTSNPRWMDDLNLHHLKYLYKYLESGWMSLSEDVRFVYQSRNRGSFRELFPYSFNQIVPLSNTLENKLLLKNTILNIFELLMKKGVEHQPKETCATYFFLKQLTKVSREAYETLLIFRTD